MHLARNSLRDASAIAFLFIAGIFQVAFRILNNIPVEELVEARKKRVGTNASALVLTICAFLLASCSATGVIVTPKILSFGNIDLGSTSTAQTVTVKNISDSAINVSSISISGPNAGDFTITNRTCGSSMAGSSSCTIAVVFAPTANGVRNGTLTIANAGLASARTVSLSGNGTGMISTLAVTPSALIFPAMTVGVSSAPQTVTLQSSGTTVIAISGVSVSGVNASDFAISSRTCGSTLAGSATCTISVIFTPSGSGARVASLTISDSASGSPHQVALSGTGAAPIIGNLNVSPASLSFATTVVGLTSKPQPVAISNSSTVVITLRSIAIAGANAGDFLIASQSCGSTLAPGADCTVNVAFKPAASGARIAVLTLADSAGNSPQTVSLSGEGSPRLSISPLNPTVYVNGTLQFSATFDVTWAASCGAIDSRSGFFTAPSVTGTCTVTATEIGGSAKASTVVTVTSKPSSGTLAIYHTSAAVFAGTTQAFQAQLSGVPDTNSLSYSIDGVAGGNAITGTITNTGVYTAPNADGKHTITVVDNALGLTAIATATVYSKVSVDFASRATTLHAVPADLFGAERMDSLHNAADLDLVKAGGIRYARFYAQIPAVFATSTPNWSSIDTVIQRVSAGGVKVMLQMFQTPPWLQPNPNPCGSAPLNVLPTDLASWGKMAAQYVKHMDETFPGVVTDYEIWNEPNTAALCDPGGSKMTDYLALYTAAAPLMRAQAKADGSSARVGGPATAGLQSAWVSAMLSDATISQNIDFMSYHDYMFSNKQLSAQWNTYNGTTSVYQKTQNTGAGPLSTYLRAANLVAAGKQPQGKDLLIYNSEYNLNWDYAKTCCQNDPTYSPVWNSMYIADLLNAIYSGAPHTISRMVYFAANAHPYFCLIGEINANMDCLYPSGSVPQPYPSYFAYQLFGATNYLGLQSGGHMAQSISPRTLGNGLVVTAFYTQNLDAIVLVNPGSETLRDVPVSAANTGISSANATFYQIVNGQSIRSSTLSLQLQGGTSYSTTVSLEPYSVQAISIHK